MKVELISKLGEDVLTPANAARVSYANHHDTIEEPRDPRLVRSLSRMGHFSPFRHIVLQFRCEDVPEFVARQVYKHVVGSEVTSTYATKDHAWNEVSGRYVTTLDENIYTPSAWRSRPGKGQSKQGSGAPLPDASQAEASRVYGEFITHMRTAYASLLGLGVAPEQARMVLPMSFCTSFYWTVSFQAVMHFLDLRQAPDAQREVRDFADEVERAVREAFPRTMALWDCGQNGCLCPDDDDNSACLTCGLHK